ncbi:hypothetical protein AMECASPLE_037048 [Ameca splendens]|uniref:Uncharacterized protein n=1 Tax=Ameca splendens TaxID=208324 RepID=A0ABV0ZGJ3_9TELE
MTNKDDYCYCVLPCGEKIHCCFPESAPDLNNQLGVETPVPGKRTTSGHDVRSSVQDARDVTCSDGEQSGNVGPSAHLPGDLCRLLCGSEHADPEAEEQGVTFHTVRSSSTFMWRDMWSGHCAPTA